MTEDAVLALNLPAPKVLPASTNDWKGKKMQTPTAHRSEAALRAEVRRANRTAGLVISAGVLACTLALLAGAIRPQDDFGFGAQIGMCAAAMLAFLVLAQFAWLAIAGTANAELHMRSSRRR